MEQYRFEPDLARASTLPASWYWDAELLRLEGRAVFGRTWQWVGLVSQLERPGDFLVCQVGAEPVVVTRGEDGILRAFSNVCRHRAGAVAMGCGNRKRLQCQYHGWLYDLEGRLLKAPEFEGVRGFDPASERQPAFRVDTWGPFVFVNTAPEGPSLQDWLGRIPEETRHLPLSRMAHVRTHDYALACNWKVYVDNYLEGYHIPVAHPELFHQVDYGAYRVETARFYSKQFAPIRAQESLYRRALEVGRTPQALYYWVFPNLMLNLYPDHLQVNLILPDGPERCVTRFLWYAPNPALDLGDNFAFSDRVQEEDILLCETAQRHLRSAYYGQGRFSVKRENGVHHFHGLMAEFLRLDSPGPGPIPRA